MFFGKFFLAFFTIVKIWANSKFKFETNDWITSTTITFYSKMPLNTNFNTINNSPFTKMKKINQNINKINVICEGNPIKQIKTMHDNKINNSPF
jgi:hypothetical protein